MGLLKIMQKRRSIRKYTDESIPDDKLEKILQAGLLSASARNIRPWEFIVVKDKETLKLLADSRQENIGRMLEGADCAIVVLADASKAIFWIEDSSSAMTNMHLMASYLGIGSCWVQGRDRMATETLSTEDVVREKLEFPENYKLEAILSLGMPAVELEERKLEDLEDEKIHWEKFQKK